MPTVSGPPQFAQIFWNSGWVHARVAFKSPISSVPKAEFQQFPRGGPTARVAKGS